MTLYTDHLLTKHASDWQIATTHPFLVAAGDGSISTEVLSQWLRQDYLYAYIGYTKFASSLLARIPISPSPPTPQSPPLDKTLAKAVPLLTFSLANITKETDFFTTTAKQHHLDIHPNGIMPHAQPGGLLGPYEAPTRAYVDFMIATGSGATVEGGLVLLWAMEKAYLTAWTFAKSHMSSSPPSNDKEHALSKFIHNWSGSGMQSFVQQCEDVVNGLEIDPSSETGKKCEEVFKYCIWLEQRFWPSV